MDSTALAISTALFQWEQQVNRSSALLNQISDERLEQHVAPGKNTGTYIVGHLIAIHDAMTEILGLGKGLHEDMYKTYLASPDGSGLPTKSVAELRQLWKDVHDRVTSSILTLSQEAWLSRHESMTDADYVQNPLRNKLSVLLNRTNHFAFHLGQLRLFI